MSALNLICPGLPPRVGGINLNEQESREFRERLQNTIKASVKFQAAKVSNKEKPATKRKRQPFELKIDKDPIDLVKLIINALRKKTKTV
jgi:hypothetical protein